MSRPWEARRLHFVGVGGAGMSGYARAAHALGAQLSGSDGADSSYLQGLRADGVLAASIGHDAANVPAGSDVELIYSSAIPAENAERAAARERGLRERPRAELLAEFTALKRTIAVAGTHGKTTTSSMLVHALRAAGQRRGRSLAARARAGSLARRGSGRRRAGERALGGRRAAGGRGRRVGSLDAEPRRRDRGVDQRRARPPRHVRIAARAAGGVPRVPRARARRGRRLGSARVDRAHAETDRGRALRRAGAAAGGGGLALHVARAGGTSAGSGRAQRAQRGGRAGGGATGRGGPARGDRGAGRLRRCGPTLSTAGAQPRGGAALRGLRAPPDRGRGDAERGAHVGAPAAGGGLPAASVLAYAAARRRVRSGAGAGRRGRRARRVSRARARRGPSWGQRVAGRAGGRRCRSWWAGLLATDLRGCHAGARGPARRRGSVPGDGRRGRR